MRVLLAVVCPGLRDGFLFDHRILNDLSFSGDGSTGRSSGHAGFIRTTTGLPVSLVSETKKK